MQPKDTGCEAHEQHEIILLRVYSPWYQKYTTGTYSVHNYIYPYLNESCRGVDLLQNVLPDFKCGNTTVFLITLFWIS